MNIIQFIQEKIIGDASPAVTRKLNEYLEVIALDVYDYHNWTWLKKSHTLTLTTEIEYSLSGANNNLAKVCSMFYGTDMVPLSDEYQDEEAFYKLIYGKTTSTTPICYVPKERVNAYTWKFIIYPCSGASGDTVTYFYKKVFNIGDVQLYPNPLVFIHGVLNLFYAARAAQVAPRDYAVAQVLARDYLAAFLAGKEEMRTKDSAVTHPKTKIDISEERKRLLATGRRYRTLARR